MTPYLSLAIWVPIVAGLAVLAVGRDRDAGTARFIALVGALTGFLVTVPLYWQFDVTTGVLVQDPTVGVTVHETRIKGDEVQVRLTPDATRQIDRRKPDATA